MPSPSSGEPVPFCPSAHPAWRQVVAIGVVAGTSDHPRVAYFPNALPLDQSLLEMSAPASPTSLFRFAAPCIREACEHFRDGRCGLVDHIVQSLPSEEPHLPLCPIRSACLWWQQHGRTACLRCPQVVTDLHNPSPQTPSSTRPAAPSRQSSP